MEPLEQPQEARGVRGEGGRSGWREVNDDLRMGSCALLRGVWETSYDIELLSLSARTPALISLASKFLKLESDLENHIQNHFFK